MHLLEIKDLTVDFNTFAGVRRVLDIERIEINQGDAYGLVGESGAGKTVLALSLLQLLQSPPATIKGTIRFEGQEVLEKSDGELRNIRGRKIAMIFQDPMSTLNPVFTIGTQITRVIKRHEGHGTAEAKKRAVTMLELVELPDARNTLTKYPHELSGGQRQRAIIAIALSCGAEFLIADEPTRNLDVTIQAGILKLLDSLRSNLGVTVLFIANNLGLVSAVCTRVGILLGGHVVEQGSLREVVREARHPYTKALLRPLQEKTRDVSRQGWQHGSDGGSSAGNDVGCPFRLVCQQASDHCGKEFPTLVNVGGTHLVACMSPHVEAS